MCFFKGDGSTHPADPWSTNGTGAPLQQQQQQQQPYGPYSGQQQVGPTPPLMNPSGPSGNNMGQPPYPGQGIFSKSYKTLSLKTRI